MTSNRTRLPAAVVLLSGLVLATVLGLGTNALMTRQSSELLDRRASEVAALLAADLDRVESTIRSLRPIVESDAAESTFVASAAPHLQGRVRAIAALRPAAGGFDVIAVVGDGLPNTTRLDERRGALATRALSSPDLVTGVITDEWRRRVVVAEGPAPGGPEVILWYESAVDPHLPHPLTGDEPFSELYVALYASDTADPDALVLVSDPERTATDATADVLIQVGRDEWLVRVAAAQSLIGSAAELLPEVVFGAVVTAGLAAAVVTWALGRRRDYALELVDERTAELQDALTRAERAQQELTRRVLYDPLTGLPTRALLGERLRHALAHTRRTDEPFALLFCDLDRFKLVNDTLGHAAGDRLLQLIAQRIEHAARAEDTVARFGGDEFVVLCESVDGADEAVEVARRIADDIRVPLLLHGQQVSITASLGVAISQGDADVEMLLRWADTAMYGAKERGRDRIQVFDDDLSLRTTERFQTEQELRSAITDGLLEVHYQPIVSLRSDRTDPGQWERAGFEALVRWPTEDGIFRLPDRFIPLAEDTGLIVPLDHLVLAEACRFTASLNATRPESPMTVSVNLSARTLNAPGVVERVRRTLDESGLDPERLWIELTESGLMENLDDGSARLRQLRELGVRIAVDDFGTGWSSLVYLRQLPIDVIKIDRTFVAGVTHSHEDRAIVSAVVTLAESLGLDTVAEGVEAELQAELLHDLGCTRAQGYFWSPAVPPDVAWDANGRGRIVAGDTLSTA